MPRGWEGIPVEAGRLDSMRPESCGALCGVCVWGGHPSDLVVRCWSSGVRQPVFLGKASISTSMKWESKTALM